MIESKSNHAPIIDEQVCRKGNSSCWYNAIATLKFQQQLVHFDYSLFDTDNSAWMFSSSEAVFAPMRKAFARTTDTETCMYHNSHRSSHKPPSSCIIRIPRCFSTVILAIRGSLQINYPIFAVQKVDSQAPFQLTHWCNSFRQVSPTCTSTKMHAKAQSFYTAFTFKYKELEIKNRMLKHVWYYAIFDVL